jgi:uncharacterized protein (TIRG00374 family)
MKPSDYSKKGTEKKQPAKTNRKKFWFGIILSAVLIILLVSGIDLHKVAEALKGADYRYCIPMIILVIVGILIRAYRWFFIMEPLHRASMANLYSATMIGFMANFVLPARTGEIIRAYLIGKKEGVSKSASFATIVIERLFDIFTMLLILIGVLFLASRPGSPLEEVYAKTLRGGGLIMCLIFLLAMAFLVMLKQKTRLALSWVRFACRPFPERWGDKIIDVLQSFVSGLGAIHLGSHLFPIVFYSILMWGIYGLGNVFLLKAFDRILPDLPAYFAFYLLVVQAFGVALPSSPGAVGPYHAAVVAGLAAFGIHREDSLSVAIVAHIVMVLPVIIYGMVLLWKDHLSLRSLETEAGHNQENRQRSL